MGSGMLDSVSFCSRTHTWCGWVTDQECRESFWGYMQHHWEKRLRAADCLTITGDQLSHGESAIVISVCPRPLTRVSKSISWQPERADAETV